MCFAIRVFFMICGVWHCHISPNMVHPKRWSSVCCCLPAHANVSSCIILGDQLYCRGYAEKLVNNKRHIWPINVMLWLMTRNPFNKFPFLFPLLMDLLDCRVIGAILIVLGLYLVLWGKTNEKRVTFPEESSLSKPLLNAEENKEAEAAAQDIPWHMYWSTDTDCSFLVNNLYLHNQLFIGLCSQLLSL